MYQVQRPARTESIRIRTLNYHVRLWGEARPDAAPLVLLHGWMDVGASYQFVVDAFGAAFAQGRQIIAPDWRGFGLSLPPSPCDSYHFADYLADLDQLLDHYAAGRSVDLVGHSMGGNVAMMYAGARPARIRRLVNLEGFGLPATRPAQAPGRYAQWMDQIRQWERGEMELTHYDSADGVALRLMKTNPAWPATRPPGWPATGPAKAATGAGISWARPRTKSPAPSSTAWTRRWHCTRPSPRPCCRSRPATTASRAGGKGSTRWPNTANAWPTCATRARPWCRTPATCCTTTSRRRWRR